MLRDGIPLNEHFLALKNKFNNEKDEMEKYSVSLDEEIKREEYENKRKKHAIEVLKREHDEMQHVFSVDKEDKSK